MSDYLFINGFIKAKSAKLLKNTDYHKLDALTGVDFWDYLYNINYFADKNFNIDEMINDKFKQLKAEIRSLCGDNSALEIATFFHFDLSNIQAVYKSYHQKRHAEKLSDLGVIEASAIERAIIHQNYDLVADYQDFFSQINNLDTQEPLAFITSNIVVLGFKYLYEKYLIKDKYLRIYYELKFTINNIITVFRAKLMQYSPATLAKMIIPYGLISSSQFLEFYHLEITEIIDRLANMNILGIDKVLKEFKENQDISLLAQSCKRVLMQMINDFDYDIDSSGPIIRYLYLQELEIENIKRLYYKQKSVYRQLIWAGDDNG